MSIIFEAAQAVSVIVASGVAVFGIRAWQRETKWKRKYEIAEEVLSLFYECREKVNTIRKPVQVADEGASRIKGDSETNDEIKILNRANAYKERYEKEKDTFVRLWSIKFRFIAIFGNEAGLPIDNLKEILYQIFFAAKRVAEYELHLHGVKKLHDEVFEKRKRKLDLYRSILWTNYSENDEIAQKIDIYVAQIEGICKQIIRS